LVKTYQFLPNRIKIRLEIKNTNNKTISLVYRSHNQNGYLKNNKNTSGVMRSNRAIIKRNGQCQILRVSSNKQKSERYYPVKTPTVKGANFAEFSFPNNEYILQLEILGKVGFYGIWDDIPERMKYATCEIVFQESKVAPGKKEVFEMIWSLKKKK
jgi:hypothetical protein